MRKAGGLLIDSNSPSPHHAYHAIKQPALVIHTCFATPLKSTALESLAMPDKTGLAVGNSELSRLLRTRWQINICSHV